MEALRTRSDDEARRRADAEAEIARLARDAERKAAEAAALPPPLELPVYRPPPEDPAPDPAQETARRRVAALRERPAARAEPAPPPAAPDPDPEPPRTTVRPPPAELRSGTLADLPAPRLLALAARAEVCGRLDFEGAATRSLFLEEGRIVGVTSSAPAERIDELLLPIATGPSAAALGLSPAERRVVALSDGLRTLDEVLAASPLDALSTRQVLAALILVGALAVRTFQGGRPAAAATA